MLKKVAAHIKRYNPYSMYAAKSELKGEVGSSYLTWMWWILDPVLFMLVYVFITVVVFKSQGEYLPVVVIIGLTVWNFFNKTVMVSRYFIFFMATPEIPACRRSVLRNRGKF